MPCPVSSHSLLSRLSMRSRRFTEKGGALGQYNLGKQSDLADKTGLTNKITAVIVGIANQTEGGSSWGLPLLLSGKVGISHEIYKDAGDWK